MAKKKKNYTHQVIYADSGRLIITTPRGWARDNQNHFPDFFHNNKVPRTERVNKKLDELGFKTSTSAELVIHHKFD